MSIELQAAFDACLDRLLRGEISLEQCLQEYPGQADELRAALIVALDLQGLAPLPMSEEALERGLALMHAELGRRRREAPQTRAPRPWQRLGAALPRFLPVRVAGLAAALAVALIAYGGVTLAAVNSGPDSALYGYRLSLEEFRIGFASGEDRARLYLETAEQRVREIEDTVARGDSSATRHATDAYQSFVRKGVDALGSAAGVVEPVQRERTAAVVATFRERLRDHQIRFDSLSSGAAAVQGSIDVARRSATAGLIDVQAGPILALAPTPAPTQAVSSAETPTATSAPTAAPAPTPAAEILAAAPAVAITGSEVIVTGILDVVAGERVVVSGVQLHVGPELLSGDGAFEPGTWVEAVALVDPDGLLALQELVRLAGPVEPAPDSTPTGEVTPTPTGDVTPAPEGSPTAEPTPAGEVTPAPEGSPTAEPTPAGEVAPTPEPEPSPTAEPTPTGESVTPAPEPSPTAEPTPTGDVTPTPESSPTTEPTPAGEATPTPEPSPTAEPTPTDEATPAPAASSTAEPTPASEATPTPEPSPTAEPTPAGEVAPTPEPEPSPTAEPTPTGESVTPAPEPSPTAEPTPTGDVTPTPESSPTTEPTPAGEATPTPEPSPTAEPTPTDEATPAPAASSTAEPTPASEATPTPEPSPTAEPTPAGEVAPTPEPEPSPTAEPTPTGESVTPAPEPSPTAEPTPTGDVTPTPESSPTTEPSSAGEVTPAPEPTPPSFQPPPHPSVQGVLQVFDADRVLVGGIQFTPSAELRPALETAPALGAIVRVEFEPQVGSGGEVRLIALALVTVRAPEPDVIGALEAIDEATIMVDGRRIALRVGEGATVFEGEPQVGDLVLVELAAADGVFEALRVSIASESPPPASPAAPQPAG